MPLASIIIPNWNGRKWLERCLPALREQSCQDFEIIIVDNASTDDSVRYVDQSFPEAVIAVQTENTGFARACNVGMGLATGEFYVFLNNDTQPQPTWLEELIGGLRRHPECGFAACKLLFLERPELINAAGDMVIIDGTAYNRGLEMPNDGAFDSEEYVFSACAAASVFRREVIEKIGPFDPDFYFLFEDVDLCFRAQLAGFRGIYVPSSVCLHKGAGSWTGIHHGAVGIYHGNKNEILLLLKNLPGPLWRRYFFKIVWRHIRICLSHFRRNIRPFLVLKAKFAALLMLPQYLKKRRVVMQLLCADVSYIDSWLQKELPPEYRGRL